MDPLDLDFEAPDGLEHQLLTFPVREGTALGWLELVCRCGVAGNRHGSKLCFSR